MRIARSRFCCTRSGIEADTAISTESPGGAHEAAPFHDGGEDLEREQAIHCSVLPNDDFGFCLFIRWM
jgi:hypothetical protein